ncbi:MAG: hypothetical protein KDK07_18610 [Bauldia sp.]|nr:hypothetical protein [Bauldia sp.]
MAFAAILKILPALEPDAQRLAAANLDPRRLSSYVSDRAREQSPADFFETEADDKEQAAINAYILRTLLFRSLEHLQRVAMRAWMVRLLEDRLPVPALPEEPFLPEITDAVLEWERELSGNVASPAGDIAAGIAEVLGGLLTKPVSRHDDPAAASPRSSDVPEQKIGVDEVTEATSPAEMKPAGEAGAERRDRGPE